MEYKMKLQPKYYDDILYGTKRIELRLYDEKRKEIHLGDTIEFIKEPELKESFKAKVVGLLRYSSFEELMNDFDISVLADKNRTKKELLDTLETFYSKEKQEHYSVLGIRIELE